MKYSLLNHDKIVPLLDSYGYGTRATWLIDEGEATERALCTAVRYLYDIRGRFSPLTEAEITGDIVSSYLAKMENTLRERLSET